MTGLLVLLVTLAVAGVAGAVFTARNGRVRPASERPSREHGDDARGVGDELAALGLEAGERATLLQFSSTFCAPCRTTRTLLSDVAAAVPGVRHVELDVADGNAALALVRRLDIRRTPTTLVLDAAGREVRRASGVPRREQVVAALAGAVEPQNSPQIQPDERGNTAGDR
jgi:thiol-disulfide isomerase/thioredoxin